MSTSYRPDVDGLRAVAIVPVVLYHLGVRPFGGGFVGVDVFFVISGFLITSLIHAEMIAGKFSILAFYERRIRRLFPALFVVMAACTFAALALYLPPDLQAFSRSLIATTLFSANLLFWKTAGYFTAAPETKPFLHAWSLAVEEQFYIFYPPLLLLVVKFARRRIPMILATLAMLSFVASVVEVHAKPNAAFYLPQFRAWELLLGALLAVQVVPPPKSRIVREALSALGLCLIGVAVVTYGSDTPFPGVSALLPTLGAALIIYTGSGGPSRVNRALSLRPMVFIGWLSYSLYLWHWPVIVFAEYFAMRELTATEKAMVVLVSVALAILSWAFVERPFRGKGGILSRRLLFGASFASMAGFIAVGALGYLSRAIPLALFAGGGPTRRPVGRADPVSDPGMLRPPAPAHRGGRALRVGGGR